MTIFLATNSDGMNTEGIGAMVQYQMACYAASKKYGIKYAFFGFKNLTHYQYFNITQQQFCDDVNKFFSFPNQFVKGEDYEIQSFFGFDNTFFEFVKSHSNEDNTICFISPKGLMNFLESNIEEIYNSKTLIDLRSNLQFPFVEETKNQKQISLHVRKYMHTDCDPNPIRDCFDSSKRNRLTKLVDKLSNLYPQSDIHIHSQGNDLIDIKNDLKANNVTLHLDEYPIKSIYRMINSDILVAANSSMSYISHLFGKPITLIRDSFYHKMYSKNTIFLDDKFFFNEKKLVDKV